MTIIFPENVRQLKVELGKDILRANMASIGQRNHADALIERSNDPAHIEAAELLRNYAPSEVMTGLARLAERALNEMTSGIGQTLMSIMSDLMSSYNYVGSWLGAQPPYLGELFKGLGSLDEDQMRATLGSIAAYARGE